MNENTKFKIIVPSYNSEKWIEKTLSSVAFQNYNNYDVMVIDDCSTDSNQKKIIQEYCKKYNSEKNKWNYIFNTDRKFALYNIVNGICCFKCNNNDVIIILDGDDWFYDNEVLNKVNNCYCNNDVYMTYGQYISYPSNEVGRCREISSYIIKNKLYRKTEWLFSHLKTFKFDLFKKIKVEDFLDIDGKFMKMTYDLAIIFPIAEMSGGKFKFINDILYVYNNDNPINDYKVNIKEQIRIENLIKSRKIYKTVV